MLDSVKVIMANDISLEFAGSVPDQLLFNTDSDGSLTFTLGGGSGDAAACNSKGISAGRSPAAQYPAAFQI